jgi:F1F0 ATPase subunit 2
MGTLQTYIAPFFIGNLMGLLYFAGLWQTVRRLPETPRPYRLMLYSYVGRLALALGGFYLFMDGPWERLAAVIAGFLAARTILVRILGRGPGPIRQGVTAWKS